MAQAHHRARALPGAVLALALAPVLAASAENPCPSAQGGGQRVVASEDEAQRVLDAAAACGDRLVGIAAPQAGQRGRDRWALRFERAPERHETPRARVVMTAPTAEDSLERRLCAAGRGGYRLAAGLVARDRRPFWSRLDQRDVVALVLERPAAASARWEYLVLEPRTMEEPSYQGWFPASGSSRFTDRLRDAEAAGFREILAHPLVLEREIPARGK